MFRKTTSKNALVFTAKGESHETRSLNNNNNNNTNRHAMMEKRSRRIHSTSPVGVLGYIHHHHYKSV
eukprot:2573017-Ditylum_brightwellii.AAC.1